MRIPKRRLKNIQDRILVVCTNLNPNKSDDIFSYTDLKNKAITFGSLIIDRVFDYELLDIRDYCESVSFVDMDSSLMLAHKHKIKILY